MFLHAIALNERKSFYFIRTLHCTHFLKNKSSGMKVIHQKVSNEFHNFLKYQNKMTEERKA